ncbi:MAG: hypothetical protein IJK99_05395, partial [Bacteroidales bacterium]|nr:hypothetical protein [Bacteroidales bacterium]
AYVILAMSKDEARRTIFRHLIETMRIPPPCIVFPPNLVVIPLRMNGFYNNGGNWYTPSFTRCHTAPNERLLQRFQK